jgi:hypothetical protein
VNWYISTLNHLAWKWLNITKASYPISVLYVARNEYKEVCRTIHSIHSM